VTARLRAAEGVAADSAIPSLTDVTTSHPNYQAAAELRKGLRRLAHSTERITREHGLTPRRYELLLFIQAAADAGTPATVTSLCESLWTSQTSVTQLVESAVRAGLVVRTRSLTDRRSSNLHLTPLASRRLHGAFVALGPERQRLAQELDRHR
jgi:DNA-binding MarR family transcriptional regulator